MKKTGIWALVAFGVIVLEIALSYVVVTKFIAPANKTKARDIPGQSPEIVADYTAVTDTSKDAEIFNIPYQYTIADFVVNPAQSEGKHFFVTTIVFGLVSEDLRSRMEARDVILRDKLLQALGSKHYRWYTQIENRAKLREEIKTIAEEVLQVKGGVRVYFNKYVTQ